MIPDALMFQRLLPGLATGWLMCWAPCALADLTEMHVGASVNATYDDNVSRARKDDKFSDSFATLDLGAKVPWGMSAHSRVIVSANAGADKFIRYTGLDRYYANIQGELQYRNSGKYSEPIWSLFLQHGEDWYESSLRDGSRTSAGLSVTKPVTDRIVFFSALAYNERNARSTVFDTSEVSLRGNIDYALTRRQTIYIGLEGRDGDITSTARPKPAYAEVAEASVLDDVFTDTTRYSYRFKAYTGIATIGYNVGIGERAALDLSYRVAYSRLRDQPSATSTSDTIDYVDNQLSLSLLMRF
ncbi:MAG: hypothetical protein ACJ8G2_02585 [Burkholderiales bacterium]|jgi:hypothetical protein